MRQSDTQRGRCGIRRGLLLLLGLFALLCGAPALAAPSEWQTYLGDGFNESKTAFPTGQFGEAYYTVEDGEYVIDGNRASQDSLSALTDNLYYYYAEAQCRVKSSAAGELAFSGLVFHYTKTLQQQRAYYVFYVYGDGYYGAKRVIGDDVVIVIPLARSTEINTSGTNTLAVDAQGTRFDLYINGKYVNGFTDVRIDGGGFGFYVGKQSVGAFDNFKVKVERRGGGNDGPDFPASSGGNGISGRSSGSADAERQRLNIPKNPNRPTYPWEVGVDKSERARKERRESGEDPVAEPRERDAAPRDEQDEQDGEPQAQPDPERAGRSHPASDSSRDNPPPPAGPQLPPGEEMVIPPQQQQPPAPPDDPDPDKASDVTLESGTRQDNSAVSSGSSPAAQPGQFSVREERAADQPEEPVHSGFEQDWQEPLPLDENRAAGSGNTPRLTEDKPPPPEAPATALPDSSNSSTGNPGALELPPPARELTKAERDAQFKAEKERKAREKEAEKEARRETERLAREQREEEQRQRREQEAAEREARRSEEQDSLAAGGSAGTVNPQQAAAAMRQSNWDELGGPEPVRIEPGERQASAQEHPPAPVSAAQRQPEPEQPVGEGVQLPPVDSARGEADSPPAATEPPRPQLERFAGREVQPGEPSAEEAAFEARIPLYLGETGGAGVEDAEQWVEAQPGSEQLPGGLGELQLLEPGPARGPVETGDSFADKPEALRLSDDFSSQRWPVSAAEGSSYRYADGGYEIDNLAAQNMAISFQEERLDELRLECSARFLDGAGYVGYGIAARFTNTVRGISYYGFFVSQSGECLLLKVTNGQETVLADWTLSHTFRADGTNQLRLECSGGMVRGYVNNELALQARDNLLPAGGYALLAGPGVSIRFDDLALVGLRP